MIFKKALIWASLFLTVLAFQNCEFQNFESDGRVEKKGVTSVDHFSVDIREYPNVVGGTQFTTRIEAQLDKAVGFDGKEVVASNKFIITKQSTDNANTTCSTLYSVSRDEIRTLLKDIEDARVVKALKASTINIADGALYTLSINNSAKILMSSMNYRAGDLYTTDIKFPDFIDALEQLKDKIISEHCHTAINSFTVKIKEHPHVLDGSRYTSLIQASLDFAVSLDGDQFFMKDDFVITRQEAIAGQDSCFMVYRVTRDDLSSIFYKINEAQVHKATASSNVWIADAAVYTMQVDVGPEVLLSGMNYHKGDHYTTEIGFKDFDLALQALSHKVISNGCKDAPTALKGPWLAPSSGL